MKHHKNIYLVIRLSLLLTYAFVITPETLHAGPPFITDDPEPVEYHHWEFYIASQFNYEKKEISGTSPQAEITYGVIPDVQLHITAPAVYSITRNDENTVPASGDSSKWDKARFGYGNTEIGMKVRFLHESDRIPQLGIFPMVEAPTGRRSLGYTRQMQMLFPLYLQKSWNKITTYGGSGFWYNPGKDNKNYWFAGWLLQYKLTDTIAIGGEFFYNSPDNTDAEHRFSTNIGTIINFNENWHLLFSLGRDIRGPSVLFSYLAVQCTI